jgi:hypothetical protein
MYVIVPALAYYPPAGVVPAGRDKVRHSPRVDAGLFIDWMNDIRRIQ